MMWVQLSLERVLRAGLAWRRTEDALASSLRRLQTSQSLLNEGEIGVRGVPAVHPKADKTDLPA